MLQDPFGDPFKLNHGPPSPDIFRRRGGGPVRLAPKADPAPEQEAEPLSPEEAAPVEGDKPADKVILKNPKWEMDTVGFNEETEIAVEALLPESQAHKIRVEFELFAKVPFGGDPEGGGESISKATGNIKNGQAKAKIPVYIPQYRDEDGNLLSKVSYYFTAKHSGSDLLEDKQAVKVVDHMAERVIQSHILEDVTFDTGKSDLRPGSAPALKALAQRIEAWKKEHPDGKLAVFGHADAVRQDEANKRLSERRARSVHDYLVNKAYLDAGISHPIAAKDFDAIDGKPFMGCGEFNRIEEIQGESESNRRVTILLLKVNKHFPIHYPCKHGDTGPCKRQAAKKGGRRTAGFSCAFYDALVKEEGEGGGEGIAGFQTSWVREKLTAVASQSDDTAFHLWMASIFGFDIPHGVYTGMKAALEASEFADPEILLRNSGANELARHPASYDEDRNVIYLSEELVNQASEDKVYAWKLAISVAEEYGHHIDNYLRKVSSVGGDAPRDEGAFFAYHLLRGLNGLEGVERFGWSTPSKRVIEVEYASMDEGISRWLSEDRLCKDESVRNLSFQSAGITLKDVAVEMVGRTVAVGKNAIGIPEASLVEIIEWDYQDASAKIKSAGSTHRIPKSDLCPDSTRVPGLTYYDVGWKAQKSEVSNLKDKAKLKKEEADLWEKNEHLYPNNKAFWNTQLTALRNEASRLAGLLERKEKVYWDMVIRQTMYNRFDGYIKTWVDHYNAKLKPKEILDPNIIKSQFFQETRMGTSGIHLELPPYDWTSGNRYPLKSRYNLGQTIDSWGPQQYLMIKEVAPAIYSANNLGSLESQGLWRGMTNAQYANWNGSAFVRAMIDFSSFKSGGRNLLGNASDLYLDYEFWTRTGVRWLFHKYFEVGQKNWREAVRAFNGAGPEAESYANEVMSRVSGAQSIDVGIE